MFGDIPNCEIDGLGKYWDTLIGIREQIFEIVSDDYSKIKVKNVKDFILNNSVVNEYKTNFSHALGGLHETLKEDLIDDILDISSEKEKEKICLDIFDRLSKISLVDKYKAYQILAEKWEVVSTDLEMIQSEGFDAINQVDPNMVIKKKDNNSDEVPEVQEGWKGHILPFELVQKEILTDELDEIVQLEQRTIEINNILGEIIESLDEDEKGSFLNDNNDAFVTKELRSTVSDILQDVENEEIKALKKYMMITKKKEKLEFIANCDEVEWESMEVGADGTYKKTSVTGRIKCLQMQHEFAEDSIEKKLIIALELIEEESSAKKELKDKKEILHLKTKDTIEGMEEDISLRLLELKWISPLIDSLNEMPTEIISDLISKLEYLAQKYEVTFYDVEEKMELASAALSKMIDDLVGNPSDMKGLKELKNVLGGKDE